jgi:hypothetical protein
MEEGTTRTHKSGGLRTCELTKMKMRRLWACSTKSVSPLQSGTGERANQKCGFGRLQSKASPPKGAGDPTKNEKE